MLKAKIALKWGYFFAAASRLRCEAADNWSAFDVLPIRVKAVVFFYFA